MKNVAARSTCLHMHRAALLVIALTNVWGCANAPGSGTPAEVAELPRHELVFVRHSDAARRDYDIWRMCADGTQLASLVVEPDHQLQVSVSPDGSALVYASRVDGQWDVFRRDFHGGDAVNLSSHPGRDQEPIWSPDGKRIAFFSDRDAEKLELYVMDLASSAIERMTENSFYDSGAAWSPDGRRILFTRYFPAEEGSDHGGVGEVISLDLATRQETQLTQLGGYSGGLSVSPDGRRVAFHRTDDGGAELWMMNADGSEARAITETFLDEYSPEWSPDGQWIAFSAGREHDGRGTFDLWLMRPDGSQRHVVSRLANTEAWHTWRPGPYCR